MSLDWKDNEGWNKTLSCDRFYISYLETKELMSVWGLPEICETALCYDGNICILKGDCREEYEELFPDLDKCIKFYVENSR